MRSLSKHFDDVAKHLGFYEIVVAHNRHYEIVYAHSDSLVDLCHRFRRGIFRDLNWNAPDGVVRFDDQHEEDLFDVHAYHFFIRLRENPAHKLYRWWNKIPVKEEDMLGYFRLLIGGDAVGNAMELQAPLVLEKFDAQEDLSSYCFNIFDDLDKVNPDFFLDRSYTHPHPVKPFVFELSRVFLSKKRIRHSNMHTQQSPSAFMFITSSQIALQLQRLFSPGFNRPCYELSTSFLPLVTLREKQGFIPIRKGNAIFDYGGNTQMIVYNSNESLKNIQDNHSQALQGCHFSCEKMAQHLIHKTFCDSFLHDQWGSTSYLPQAFTK